MVLTQAARTCPIVEQALREAISEQLSAHFMAAMGVAQEVGDPIGRLLARALEQKPRPEIAAQIEAALPAQRIAFREGAVVATRQALKLARQRDPAPDRDPEIARLVNNLSNRLSELGRREELAAIEESVTIRSELAAARPDAFRPDHAASLKNRFNRLSALGRREEALATIEEAVELYRALASARLRFASACKVRATQGGLNDCVATA